MNNFLQSDANNPIAPVTFSAFLQAELPDALLSNVYDASRRDDFIGSVVDLASINQKAEQLTKFELTSFYEPSQIEHATQQPTGYLLRCESLFGGSREVEFGLFGDQRDFITGQTLSECCSSYEADFLDQADELTSPPPHIHSLFSTEASVGSFNEVSVRGDSDAIYLSYLLGYDVLSRDYDIFKKGFKAGMAEAEATIEGLFEIIRSLIPKAGYTFTGVQFAGGFAENVSGHQIATTGIQTRYSLEMMERALEIIQDKVQGFPEEYRVDADDIVDDLSQDVRKESINTARIGRRLKRLVSLSLDAEEIQADTINLVDSLDDFVRNIIVVAALAGVPTEQVFKARFKTRLHFRCTHVE